MATNLQKSKEAQPKSRHDHNTYNAPLKWERRENNYMDLQADE